MRIEERPQLPLTSTRKALVAAGALLFTTQLIGAALLAAPTTGPGDGRIGVFAAMWSGSVLWSVATTLCIIRQADIADVFTASLLVTIPPFALYALIAALALRGTDSETDIVSALFFGITTGALSAVVVWMLAMAVARLLRIPAAPQA